MYPTILGSLDLITQLGDEEAIEYFNASGFPRQLQVSVIVIGDMEDSEG